MKALEKLFGSPARLKILRFFMFNRAVAATSADIAHRAKLSKEAARRELAYLSGAGLIRTKRVGGDTLYQINTRFEHLDALDGFIRATTTVRPEHIIATLRQAGGLRLVTLTGFFTNSLESQMDLLVVGDRLDDRSLAKAVRTLEAELGREIRYTSFATENFRYRLGIYDRLLRDVFDYPHRLLVDKIGL